MIVEYSVGEFFFENILIEECFDSSTYNWLFQNLVNVQSSMNVNGQHL